MTLSESEEQSMTCTSDKTIVLQKGVLSRSKSDEEKAKIPEFVFIFVKEHEVSSTVSSADGVEPVRRTGLVSSESSSFAKEQLDMRQNFVPS